jgi:protein-disulfide isomerase
MKPTPSAGRHAAGFPFAQPGAPALRVPRPIAPQTVCEPHPRRGSWFLVWLALSILGGGVVRAQTPVCDALDAKEKAAAAKAFEALHPYDECDQTFARCLLEKPQKPLVLRLASDVCRMVREGKTREQIERALEKRERTLHPAGKRALVSADGAMAAGDENAPVTVAVYACARCPFCKVVVPGLYREVTEGRLKGKARLLFRPFPIKDHPGSTEAGLAILAAARLGAFWPYLLHVYQNFDAFCPKLLSDWATAVGLLREAFEQAMNDPRLREQLVASKQEGLRNGVKATPTLFIDGREYVYENQLPAMIDVLEEAAEAAGATRDASP